MAPAPQISVPGRQRLPQTLAQARSQGSAWIALMTMLLLGLPVIAAESPDSDAPGTNIVLLMDSSGSMKTTDPDNLRKPAAKLLISLLGKNDRASIISFSDQGYPVTYLLNAADTSSQGQLFTAIDKVSSRGVHTNLYSAIDTAQNVLALDKDPQRRKIVVLMSDGKMDIGDDAKSSEHTEKLLSELLPQLKANNIELRTIAFTDQSDKVLLAKIARDTDGDFYVADNDTELHNTFTKIFEQTSQPSMLPVEGGHFQIDNAIKEITIIGSKENSEVELSLISPDGNNHFPKNMPDNYRWLITPMFDMITISKPQSGAWNLMASSDKNKAYIITDLELELSIQPNEPRINERVHIQAWLEKDGQVLISDVILSNLKVTAQVSLPDGRLAELPVKTGQTSPDAVDNNGIFTANLIPPTNGRYEISLTADSGTFQRKRSVSFNTSATPVEAVTPEPVVEAELTPAPEPVAEAAMEETAVAEESTETNQTLLLAIYAFIGTNIVLALSVGATMLWRKKKKQ